MLLFAVTTCFYRGSMPKVYINGRLYDEYRAHISVFDRGLMYGDGLFETIKAMDGCPLFLKEHIDRLKNGARIIGIPLKGLTPLETGIKNGLIARLLKTNGQGSGAACIRITVTRGTPAKFGRQSHGPGARPTLTTIIYTRQIDSKGTVAMQRNGTAAVFIRGLCPAIPFVKTINFLPNVLAKAEALKRKAYEGIFVDEKGRILEGSSTNVFIVSNGVIKTPPVGEGALPGITRGATLKLAERLGLNAKEEDVLTKDLIESNEAFLTNSVIDIVPLVKAGGKTLGNGRPGPITRVLQAAYASLSSPKIATH